ncbi:hypothetical protein PQO01_19520 [Lentisphaera marina]|uniref:hypothetical protein n=1 Tax=Lentisphaera marina TaxID=1111041 RepID=UPI002366DD76|nr:hypothetical protein [Lentisphaera marina]MDD7987146.1 hypothetical protein [Lentisphaera marina]
MNTDVRLGNFLINDFLRKIKEKSIETKQSLEFWDNPRELHKLLYNKPISDERLAEIKQQSQNRKKKEHEHQKYIKSLKDKNIEPITDQFIKDLDLFDSSEQRMGIVYDYAKSYKKFKNDNNTVQLDYMLQEHLIKEVFSDFKKVYVYIKRGKTSRWGGEFDRIDLDVMELIYQDMKQIMDSKKV